MTEGIHIPDEVAASAGVPEELDSGLAVEYVFPDPRRRRWSGFIYLTSTTLMVWLGMAVATRYLVVAAVFAVLALWHFSAAWELRLNQTEALARAAEAVPFGVGHASAAISFSGLRARPRWQVIVYSPEDPPVQRGLVELDAVNRTRLGEVYLEDVPEI